MNCSGITKVKQRSFINNAVCNIKLKQAMSRRRRHAHVLYLVYLRKKSVRIPFPYVPLGLLPYKRVNHNKCICNIRWVFQNVTFNINGNTRPLAESGKCTGLTQDLTNCHLSSNLSVDRRMDINLQFTVVK